MAYHGRVARRRDWRLCRCVAGAGGRILKGGLEGGLGKIRMEMSSYRVRMSAVVGR